MEVQVVASGASGQQQPAQSAVPAAGAQAPAPAAAPQPGVLGSAPQVENTGALSPVVAKIFGSAPGSAPQPVSVNVSYRVMHDPNIIVTVFTDPRTGQEIAQVPAEVLIQIAQFFDKESGVTLDRSA